MSLNPGGEANYSWNYSKPDKPGYSPQLIGTVVAIQEVQKRAYQPSGQPGQPEFWPDGNPKMNIRIALVTQEGELKTLTFQPASKQARQGLKRSIHMDLFHLTGDTDMMNLVGQTICIQTQPGNYGQGNPRPWYVSIVEGGPYQLPNGLPAEFKAPRVLANDAAAGGQVTPPQSRPYDPYAQMGQYRQQAAQQMHQMQHPQQPMMQTYPSYTQPQYQQPMQQQMPMAYQPQPQPVQQQGYPNGMDPTIAAAMVSQAFNGPVTVDVTKTPMPDQAGSGEVYDDEMSF